MTDFDDAVGGARGNPDELDSLAQTLFSKLTPDERLHLLDGDDAFWPGLHNLMTDGYNRRPIIHGAIARLGIPGIRFADGPRGCVVGNSTAFPVPMARGATWDTDLESRIGLAIGREARAQGANFFGGVCVNLPRHPAWGRIQETYGEDPILLGEFGAALTRGIQRNMMACVKHYALNSMENARFQVDVDVNLDVLHETYLAHFRRIVEEGVAAVMSSYNSVRGEWAGQNRELLWDILREQWGFKGFVLSDFLFGLREGPLSLKNGLNVEAPFSNIRSRTLKTALDKGDISEADIERAGVSILRKQIENASRYETPEPQTSVIFCDEHRRLAREAAAKSITLLKNSDSNGQPLLPLSSGDLFKVAVFGRLANSKDTGDKGSSAVRCPEVVSPYEGIKAALPGAEVLLDDSGVAESSKTAAAGADVAVVVVGYDWRDEGEYTIPPFKTNPDLKKILPPVDDTDEAKYAAKLMLEEVASVDLGAGENNYGLGAGGDRDSLRLKPSDVELIRAATEANPRTIVAIVAAGAVIMSDWDELPPSILYNWYSGSEGGHALADVLFGRVNPSGRLPFSIPTTEKHLPFFDKNATKITYDRFFGQRLLDRQHVDAAYPLGFGLSYTNFTTSDLSVDKTAGKDRVDVTVKLKNTGKRAGRFVAQTYAAANVPDRPRRVLLGFHPVDLAAGEEREAQFSVSTRPLQKWMDGRWELYTRHIELEVGRFSGDVDSTRVVVQFPVQMP